MPPSPILPLPCLQLAGMRTWLVMQLLKNVRGRTSRDIFTRARLLTSWSPQSLCLMISAIVSLCVFGISHSISSDTTRYSC